MQRRELIDLISSLSEEQQAVVEEFVKYLHTDRADRKAPDFRISMNNFIREHSELLKRLAE